MLSRLTFDRQVGHPFRITTVRLLTPDFSVCDQLSVRYWFLICDCGHGVHHLLTERHNTMSSDKSAFRQANRSLFLLNSHTLWFLPLSLSLSLSLSLTLLLSHNIHTYMQTYTNVFLWKFITLKQKLYFSINFLVFLYTFKIRFVFLKEKYKISSTTKQF